MYNQLEELTEEMFNMVGMMPSPYKFKIKQLNLFDDPMLWIWIDYNFKMLDYIICKLKEDDCTYRLMYYGLLYYSELALPTDMRIHPDVIDLSSYDNFCTSIDPDIFSKRLCKLYTIKKISDDEIRAYFYDLFNIGEGSSANDETN